MEHGEKRWHVMWRERAREKDREEEKRCGEATDGARRARGHIARGRAAAPHAAAVPLVVMKCQSSKRFEHMLGRNVCPEHFLEAGPERQQRERERERHSGGVGVVAGCLWHRGYLVMDFEAR